ncbi:OmpA family protein [Hymenobacter sp. IS2118]|uniref:OmpA family protein n=1 Tax=Hymenobacter sp. IS2118 TaxID=1505605 RepID=UPI0005566106|nr:OmpA family protein [Hymenobacter sp. IS2118]
MVTSIRFLLACALLAGMLPEAAAQNVPFTPERFPYKEALKAAQKAIKDGEEDYKNSPPRYAAALPSFLEAQKLNPNNAALNLRIGDCYLNLGDKATALPYLKKAVELETGPAPRTHFVLARALHLHARWPEALKEYERAKTVVASVAKKGKPAPPVEVSPVEVARRIAECKTGQQLMAHPVRVFIDNLGPTVNTAETEHSPVVTADESMLFLTSRRAGSLGGARASDGGGFTEDIYQTLRSGEDWGPARTLNAPVNTTGHDATVAVSADGQRLLLHADNNGGDLSESRLTANGWSKPKELDSRINSKYRESSATYSPDGRYVYFVSDKPEGSLGKRDIYKAEIDGRTPPQNLGSAINTPFDEEGVFMQPDGKTLIFSSAGHGTMGGLDIFKSVFENGKWSTPENLGWPINSPEDDVFFVTSASGRFGYFASDRPGGFGGQDIYRVTFLGAEKQPVLNQQERPLATRAVAVRQPIPKLSVPVVTAEVTVLKGTVTDIASRQPAQAQIEVLDNMTGQTVATLQTTPAGKYLIALPSGVNYGLVLRNEAYLFHSENVNLPPSTGYAETVRNIRLQKMEAGSNIVLHNVFFDPGKASMRPESTAELERVVKLLNESPKLKLQVCGHTDEAGSTEGNLSLSERRAQAVATYLIQHKIKPERVTYAGYGAAIPLTSNKSDIGHQYNRRTEFKVVSR